MGNVIQFKPRQSKPVINISEYIEDADEAISRETLDAVIQEQVKTALLRYGLIKATANCNSDD